ncbi:hypothetical protein BRD14_00605 [Halobacteriales archaeon SW_5_68_122]|nr:MAG: hypothetical protein BRD14_00605 [Halobacteriales archaeon SW_5_68_122]
MSERETDAGEDAWEPTFPWERAGRWLRAAETGRFIVYNVLVFGLVGAAFALQALPVLAVVSGVLAGLFLRTSPGAKATTGAVGVAAGGGTLLALFVGTSLLLRGRLGLSGLEGLTPVLSAVGAIAVGAGTAALTDLFLPTRPNG